MASYSSYPAHLFVVKVSNMRVPRWPVCTTTTLKQTLNQNEASNTKNAHPTTIYVRRRNRFAAQIGPAYRRNIIHTHHDYNYNTFPYSDKLLFNYNVVICWHAVTSSYIARMTSFNIYSYVDTKTMTALA